jgi:hypothetical protein
MALTPFIMLIIFLVIIGKCWRFFLETSEDIHLIRRLEPWYWFIFLNLLLSLIVGNYDYHFLMVGLLLQLALSAWFAVSMSWLVHACHHKWVIMHRSWFQKGRCVKFCLRCGTRLPKDFHSHIIKQDSWQILLFQIPPHLFEYVVFWFAQSMMILITFFLALRMLKKPEFQNEAVLVAVGLIILTPPAIYYFGRFKRYLFENKGLIWWDDLKKSLVVWPLFLFGLWLVLKLFY